MTLLGKALEYLGGAVSGGGDHARLLRGRYVGSKPASPRPVHRRDASLKGGGQRRMARRRFEVLTKTQYLEAEIVRLPSLPFPQQCLLSVRRCEAPDGDGLARFDHSWCEPFPLRP